MDVQVKIDGLDEVERKLKSLPVKFGNRAMRRALRKGANLIRDAARTNARRVDDPQTPEVIAKNIVTQSMSRARERQAGAIGMRVGVLGGAKSYKKGSRRGKEGTAYVTGGDKSNPGGDTFYWRFLEFGTSEMKAQPFMRPAMASQASAVFTTVAAQASVELAKELEKL